MLHRQIFTRPHDLLPGAARCVSSVTQELQSQVLTFGNGLQGALGLGGDTNEYEPELVMEGSLVKVGAGHYHSFCIDGDGRLWSWGGTYPAVPSCDTVLSTQVTSSTGSGVASFATTSEGHLLSWGTSKRGQLGLGSQQVSSPLPSRITGLRNIVAAAAGWGHALALNDDGEVYSWGFPQHGRLGHTFADWPLQDEEAEVLRRCVWEPQQVQALRGIKISQVACGLDFSLAVEGRSGRLFSFGDNSLGQLGRPPATASSRNAEDWMVKDAQGSPLLVEKVAAGLGHSIAAGKDGRLFSWGWNAGNQLGLGPANGSGVLGVPSELPLRQQSPLLAASRAHSLLSGFVPVAVTYAWGSGRDGRLGLGSQQGSACPEMVPALEDCHVRDVACGMDHSLVLVGT